jgi:di/tricarboxylate transporter
MGAAMLPDLPSYHALAAMAIVVAGLYLFASDRFGLATAGLGILLVLVLGSFLFPLPDLKPVEFLANFGDEALVTTCVMLLMVKGLEVTGALEPVTRLLSRSWQLSAALAIPLTLLVAALLSAFINDTPLMSMLFPLVLASAVRSGTSPSRVLLPLNHAVLIGGMATTVGTSTNLLALGVARDLDVPGFALFDFTPPMLLAATLGLLFVWLAAGRLLPVRQPGFAEASHRVYSAVLFVNAGSPADGRTLAELLARTQQRMRVERVERGDDLTVAQQPLLRVAAGDRLHVRDTAERLKEYERLLGATLYNAGDLQRPVGERRPLDPAGQQLAEVVITRGSPLYQRVLDVADFLYRYRLLPLALHRGSTETEAGVATDLRLRAGDVILVQGAADAVRELKQSGSMLVLDGALDLPRNERAPVALGILVLVMAVVAFDLMAVSVAALLGVTLMLLTGCLEWRHIQETLTSTLVMVMAASLCLATALIKTGAAAWLAGAWVAVLPAMPAALTLALVMLLVTALANVVNNNAAAVVALPVAVGIAAELGLPAQALVLAVIFAANMPFATSYGYQTNALIMGPGGYLEEDYRRFGLPLTVLMLPALVFGISVNYGLL